MRRTGRDTGAARAISGRIGSERCEPSRRRAASKPDPVASPEATLASGLYLVATPIGNLGDVTLRALAVLRGVDRIFCEDSRVTARLLARYDIVAPLELYHDHNAERARPAILAALRRGGKKPAKRNASGGKPERINAVSAAEGPGIAVTGRSSAIAARTSL